MAKPKEKTERRDSRLKKAENLIEKCKTNGETELHLFHLGLTSLPESLGELTHLEALHLGYNALKTLPEWIGQLTVLRELYVYVNHLSSLPRAVGRLQALRMLILRENDLATVPNCLRALTGLEILDLSKNPLKSLPDWIGELVQLKILQISNAQLTSLPESLRKLTSLKYLYLHDNPALDIPPEVLGGNWNVPENSADPADILDYYFRTRGGERRPLNEAKLILVGRGAVGKTSLVNRLVHGTFDKDETKTEGIKITQWPVQLRGDDIRLHIWDFGGQEIMHATHQFFLTQRSVYLLVLNGREGGEDADAEYWLSLIQSFGSDSPVIVVLNKYNEHPFDLNRRALMKKFPAVRSFVETDCDDAKGIDELRAMIERETDGLEHLRDAFPASWFAIKEHLAGMDDNYLSFEQYRDVCSNKGETDGEAQELLASFLHTLGIALNYKDDPRLRDTHVLNPKWVTNGIYKILNARQLTEEKGELRVGDLGNILDPKDYPAERHDFLFELMRKFELCFSFPDDGDGRYLIPELLDKEQSAEADEFDPETCLNFQYHYSVLPEGLLPRFIVRTRVLSTGQARWRTGVILEFEGNRALVRADVQDKKVFVSVKGPARGRRRLLAVIRSDFDRIQQSFRFKPAEMVPVPKYPDVVVPYEKLRVLEAHGKEEYDEVVGDMVLGLKVKELLDGVDLKGRRAAAEGPQEVRDTLRLFYSYAHEDEQLRDRLNTHLKIFERQGLIEPWHDREITAGDEWKGQIDDNLERADIILLLVSADFIASDYCYEIEMKRAMERSDAGEAEVIPVILRDANWTGAPFGKLQALPKYGKAVMTWDDTDSAWKDVSLGIEKAIGKRRKRREK